MQYLPFGESFIDQRNSTWETPYTFSAKEKDLETGYSYFGARYYNSDISVWLSVDPLADKYPSMSSYMYTAGNPVMLIDPDGRKIKGFSINDKGEVEVNSKKASKKALAVYEEMKKTETGNSQFKKMVESETKIKIKLTEKKLYDSNGNMIHGETYGTGITNDGNYKKATIYISTAKTGDRFDNATKGEIINAVGVHESVHATDAGQIAKDLKQPASWATEKKPIEMEYKSRTEYNKGDNSKFKSFYEDPNPKALDPYGNPKPSFYFPIKK